MPLFQISRPSVFIFVILVKFSIDFLQLSDKDRSSKRGWNHSQLTFDQEFMMEIWYISNKRHVCQTNVNYALVLLNPKNWRFLNRNKT